MAVKQPLSTSPSVKNRDFCFANKLSCPVKLKKMDKICTELMRSNFVLLTVTWLSVSLSYFTTGGDALTGLKQRHRIGGKTVSGEKPVKKKNCKMSSFQ